MTPLKTPGPRQWAAPIVFPLLFAFSLFCLFPASASRAEQIMDSADTLVVAQRSAFDRVKNGFFPDALSAEQKALKTARERLGPTHPGLAAFLTDLATIDRYMARYADAESDLQWALALREKAFGPDDPRVAESCRQLAALYEEWGRWTDAEFWARKSVEILEKQAGGPETNLCVSLNLLGRIEGLLGKNREALGFLRRSLDLQKKSPLDPALRIETLNLLAGAQTAARRFSQAGDSLKEALETTSRSFAGDSVEAADALERMADFDRSRNRLAKARTLYQSALKIYRRFVGISYGYVTLPYLEKLAACCQALGDAKTAADLWGKALKTTRDAFGPDHPRTARVLLDLARSEKDLGLEKQAREHAQAALKVLESFFPGDYPLVRRAKVQLKG